MINFYKGEASKVDSVPVDGILFTDDTHEIMVNKKAYGKTTHADEAKTTAPIVVAGGPLAENLGDWPTDAAWNVGGNKVIPTGTSVQDVLRKLFLKPRNGSAEWDTTFTWNPSLGQPTVTFQMKNDSGNNVKVPDATTVVEVGTTLYAKVQKNETVNGNKRSIKCVCDEGHFLSTDGDWQSGDYTNSKLGSSSGTLVTSYSIEVTPPGGKATTTTISDFTSETTPITIEYGQNKFKATQSGITATVDALDQVDVYPSTNEKTVISTASKSPKDNSTDEDRTALLTRTGTDTIQGSYYYYLGSVSNTEIPAEFSNDFIKTNLTATDFVYNLGTEKTVVADLKIPGQKTYVIAVPDGYTVTYAEQIAGVNSAGMFKDGNNPKATVTLNLPGSKEKLYNIYSCSNGTTSQMNVSNLKLGKV